MLTVRLTASTGYGPSPTPPRVRSSGIDEGVPETQNCADIDHLGLERGHRSLTITRKGGKIVTIPLAPRTARAIDLATGERPRRTGCSVYAILRRYGWPFPGHAC